MKWTKTDLGVRGNIRYDSACGRFRICKSYMETSFPYTLYDHGQYVRTFCRVAFAQQWAQRIAEGRPIAGIAS